MPSTREVMNESRTRSKRLPSSTKLVQLSTRGCSEGAPVCPLLIQELPNSSRRNFRSFATPTTDPVRPKNSELHHIRFILFDGITRRNFCCRRPRAHCGRTCLSQI